MDAEVAAPTTPPQVQTSANQGALVLLEALRTNFGKAVAHHHPNVEVGAGTTVTRHSAALGETVNWLKPAVNAPGHGADTDASVSSSSRASSAEVDRTAKAHLEDIAPPWMTLGKTTQQQVLVSNSDKLLLAVVKWFVKLCHWSFNH